MSDDYAYIVQLQRRLDAAEAQLARQAMQVDTLVDRERDHAAMIDALVDVLADAGQLDRQELQARIQAAAIGRSHAARDEAAASQDVWDTLGKKS